ncbi:DUF6452 family protein [Flavobacterium sp. SM2513]|uniref:DUF6452 family protein n=1 Tax=Flavobacterium sp. SM2513 TaxID=3424766 RepID=UPI003D7F7B05
MKKIVAALLLVSFVFAGCEKDDICDPSTATTPRLVIEFYDNNNISLTRATTNLKIVGDGMDESDYLPNISGGLTWNDTVVYLPLRLNGDATKYKLILNSDNDETTIEMTDILEINYTRNDVYVSRGCGFKTLFNLYGNPLFDPFVLNNTPDATSGTWIKNIQVIQSQINDENEAHIKIFF